MQKTCQKYSCTPPSLRLHAAPSFKRDADAEAQPIIEPWKPWNSWNLKPNVD
ncbi:17094_t:CDS:2 [Rhizophagus irregularis]|nr:17094_t:CDS:2 [Rhizophagus irregularis]